MGETSLRRHAERPHLTDDELFDKLPERPKTPKAAKPPRSEKQIKYDILKARWDVAKTMEHDSPQSLARQLAVTLEDLKYTEELGTFDKENKLYQEFIGMAELAETKAGELATRYTININAEKQRGKKYNIEEIEQNIIDTERELAKVLNYQGKNKDIKNVLDILKNSYQKIKKIANEIKTKRSLETAKPIIDDEEIELTEKDIISEDNGWKEVERSARQKAANHKTIKGWEEVERAARQNIKAKKTTTDDEDLLAKVPIAKVPASPIGSRQFVEPTKPAVSPAPAKKGILSRMANWGRGALLAIGLGTLMPSGSEIQTKAETPAKPTRITATETDATRPDVKESGRGAVYTTSSGPEFTYIVEEPAPKAPKPPAKKDSRSTKSGGGRKGKSGASETDIAKSNELRTQIEEGLFGEHIQTVSNEKINDVREQLTKQFGIKKWLPDIEDGKIWIGINKYGESVKINPAEYLQ